MRERPPNDSPYPGVKGGFESLEKGVLVGFDFSNAFPTLGHNFIQAVLQIIHLPPFHITFILSTLTAPYHFCVGRGVVPEVIFQPQAGIEQGDPFSPLLFSFRASFVLFMFDELIGAYPFMYVDDLCVLISSRYTPNLKHFFEAMHQFSKVSGLRLNLGKSALVLKGNFSSRNMTTSKAAACAFSSMSSILEFRSGISRCHKPFLK